MVERTLFLIESPFQCLCMMEAIHYFGIDDYEVLIPYGDEFSNEMMFRFFREKGIEYNARPISHIIFDVFPLVFSKKKYKRIFVGNYSATKSYPLAVALAGFNSTINYLDDGTQALELFSENPKPRYNKLSIKVVISFYRILAFLKNVRESIFFTMYDVKSEKYLIEKNSFDTLRSDFKSEKQGAFIIGTNSSILEFVDASYIDYIKELVERIKELLPGEKIYYCPHRRDTNNKYNESVLIEMGIEIFNTSVSVEYDFLTKGINPKYVVGFLSNALYTLKKMFPDTCVETVSYKLADNGQNEENKLIEHGLNNNDIQSIYPFK